MSIKTNELQKLVSIQGADSILADSAAGTGRVPFSAAAQFFGQELVKPENAVGAALSNKAGVDFANLPSPQTALYNLGARPGENILINSHWDCMDAIINQEGQGEYTGRGKVYTIDGWAITNSSLTVTLLSDGIRLSANREDRGYIRQYFEKPLPPGTYTYSALVRGSGTGFMDVSDTGADGGFFGPNATIKAPGEKWKLVTNTVTVSESIIKMAYFRCDTGESFDISAAKLERGPVQTLAHQDTDGNWVLNDLMPNKVLELLKCQYFNILYSVPRFGEIATGQAKGGASVYCTVHLPVPKMRINPILKCDPAQWILSKQGSVASSLPVSSIEIVPAQSYDDVIKLIATPTDPSLLSTGDVYALMPNVAAGTFAVFEFDANL